MPNSIYIYTYCLGVVSGTEKQFWSSVPECHNHWVEISKGLQRRVKQPSKSHISYKQHIVNRHTTSSELNYGALITEDCINLRLTTMSKRGTMFEKEISSHSNCCKKFYKPSVKTIQKLNPVLVYLTVKPSFNGLF